jgi:hypothetical protein
MMIPNLQGQAVAVYGWQAAVGPCRARNPRWEPGMGMIPDPRQIGDGGGDGDRGFRALVGRPGDADGKHTV